MESARTCPDKREPRDSRNGHQYFGSYSQVLGENTIEERRCHNGCYYSGEENASLKRDSQLGQWIREEQTEIYTHQSTGIRRISDRLLQGRCQRRLKIMHTMGYHDLCRQD